MHPQIGQALGPRLVVFDHVQIVGGADTAGEGFQHGEAFGKITSPSLSESAARGIVPGRWCGAVMTFC
ncbi:hypothetical protein [Brevundimonas vancanneytii]|uniref:hypothetical protein n=1 Tax=Brevundimonas vancanneytii TaxID=1325724 RepID=UPI00142E3501|nr:hypothetical protein [Brevundimonas vancanneytii]